MSNFRARPIAQHDPKLTGWNVGGSFHLPIIAELDRREQRKFPSWQNNYEPDGKSVTCGNGYGLFAMVFQWRGAQELLKCGAPSQSKACGETVARVYLTKLDVPNYRIVLERGASGVRW